MYTADSIEWKMEGKENCLRVLISEDDLDDRYLFKSALSGSRDVIVEFVENSSQLVDHLCRCVLVDGGAALPNVIMADLRNPSFWFPALKELRMFRQFRHIPVHVFSISNSSQLAAMALQEGAAAFHHKPSSFQQLCRCLQRIIEGTKKA